MDKISQVWQKVKERNSGPKGMDKLPKDVVYVEGRKSILKPAPPERETTYNHRPVYFINIDGRIRETSIVIPYGDRGRLLRIRSGEDVADTSSTFVHVILEGDPIQVGEGSEMEAAAPIIPATPIKPTGAGG